MLSTTIRAAKRTVRAGLKLIRWCLVVPVARLIGQLRRPNQILSAWPGTPVQLGPKLVLFMHFDRRGAVRAQLLGYIREFKANGRDVVFVSNSGRLNPQDMAALQSLCTAVIIRRNIGYDFGAWRDAIDFLHLPQAGTEEIIFANDSVFGPLSPLRDLLGRLDYGKSDIWSLTESWQLRYHLQSFFLAFGPAALHSGAFKSFWQNVRPVPLKSYVVQAYEVGITQIMLKAGLRCAAVWGYDELIKLASRAELEKLLSAEGGKTDPLQLTRKLQLLRIRDSVAKRVALNPTSDLWRQLLISGFPFIKRELLRNNPTKVRDVADWADTLRDLLAADPDPILLDLRTMLKGGAP